MPSLPPNACLQTILLSCPISSQYDPTLDYSDIYLTGLGVKDELSQTVFLKNIRKHIKPWKIDDGVIDISEDTSVQDAADALQEGAYAV